MAKTPITDKSIMCIAYDLVYITPIYNNNQWISHFRDYYIKMDFVYTYHTKGQAIAIIKNFLKLIKT
jgi:hypothetical protein